MRDNNSSFNASVLRELISEGKRPFATVSSDSMAPLIRPGDQVQIAQIAAPELKPGMIVLIAHDELVVHRYWKMAERDGQQFLITHGDRLRKIDKPSLEPDLIGQVVARRRQGKILSLTQGPGQWLDYMLARLSAFQLRILRYEPYEPIRTSQISKPAITNVRAQEGITTIAVRRSFYALACLLTTIANVTVRFHSPE